MKRIMALTIMGLAVFAIHVSAQEDTETRQGPPPGGGNRPKPPIESALDANGDGVISAEEIANAPAALKTLDKNGDGELSADEYRPAMPRR
jgi:hypothetical protein